MVSEDTKYLADTLAEAIREGFNDLGNRFGGGLNPENVSMSLKMVADTLAEAIREGSTTQKPLR